MTIPLIFKDLTFDETTNQKILIIGDHYDKITCLSLDVMNRLNSKLKFDNVVVVNGNKIFESVLSKKYDNIKYFNDQNLLAINHIMATTVLKNIATPTVMVLFTDSKIQYDIKLKELMCNFHMYNTTLIIATTNADIFASQVEIRDQFNMIYLMSYWDKKLLYDKYAAIFPSYDDFTKTLSCMTINNGSLVIRKDMMQVGFMSYPSIIFIHKLDISKYDLSVSQHNNLNTNEYINLLEYDEDIYTLTI